MHRWYALQTKPRKECQVRDYLVTRGLEVYLPILRVPNRRYPRETREQPFFARYLFVYLDLEDVAISSINWMPGVTGLVSFDGQPASVDDAVIAWLRRHVDALASCANAGQAPLMPGNRVRITAGPLRGMVGIFDRRLSAERRARILVELLGTLTRCEIDLACLESL